MLSRGDLDDLQQNSHASSHAIACQLVVFEAFVARAADTFHDEAFALRVVLSQMDMRSLDGSVTGGVEQTREQMRQLLDGLTETPAAP